MKTNYLVLERRKSKRRAEKDRRVNPHLLSAADELKKERRDVKDRSMKANINIESFIQDIRKYAKRLKLCLEIVKNPVHPRTGKPLSKNTIRQCKTKIKTLKLLIRLKERDLIKKTCR